MSLSAEAMVATRFARSVLYSCRVVDRSPMAAVS
jgi:hypothetical protein